MGLAVITFLTACAGSSFHASHPAGSTSRPLPVLGAVILNTPVLSFNDTGLSVSDGVTHNGLWAVDSAGFDWEFSLDQGSTWTRGIGTSFEVTGDGAKMIWVRARDDAGNRSDIVRVNCVLDTMAPAALDVAGQSEGATHSLKLSGIEPGARWEYSLDEQRSWAAGQCSALGILGNSLSRIWLRQVDLAGNPSGARAFDLQSPNLVAHQASSNPLQPPATQCSGTGLANLFNPWRGGARCCQLCHLGHSKRTKGRIGQAGAVRVRRCDRLLCFATQQGV